MNVTHYKALHMETDELILLILPASIILGLWEPDSLKALGAWASSLCCKPLILHSVPRNSKP